MKQLQQTFETTLKSFLSKYEKNAQHIFPAIEYSLFNGGKRIRPLLVYTCGTALQVNQEQLHSAAIAIELIHCYSLIHDDLPAMDNADLRRGKASCHKKFDEAQAILAGDALQALAFEVLSADIHSELSATQKIKMINILAQASGMHGMVEGQAMDIAYENKIIPLTTLQQLHALKTGKIISACIQLAAIAANVDQDKYLQLQQFGDKIGLAFQIKDDILDVVSNEINLGKPTKQDAANNKSTFPALLGLNGAQDFLTTTYNQACKILQNLNLQTSSLQTITNMIYERER